MLAQALVREGLRNVAAGANPMGLKKGIERISTIFVPFFWLSTLALIVGAVVAAPAKAKMPSIRRLFWVRSAIAPVIGSTRTCTIVATDSR